MRSEKKSLTWREKIALSSLPDSLVSSCVDCCSGDSCTQCNRSHCKIHCAREDVRGSFLRTVLTHRRTRRVRRVLSPSLFLSCSCSRSLFSFSILHAVTARVSVNWQMGFFSSLFLSFSDLISHSLSLALFSFFSFFFSLTHASH